MRSYWKKHSPCAGVAKLAPNSALVINARATALLQRGTTRTLGSAMTKYILISAALWVCNAVGANVNCFKENTKHSAYVIDQTLSLLSEAGIEHSRISEITLGDRVCVLRSKRIGATEWGFVQTYYLNNHGESLRGWVPTAAIAYKNQLKRLKDVDEQKVEVEIGDYFVQYHISRGGSFKVFQAVAEHKCKKGEVPNEYGACEDFEWVRGYLFGKGMLAIAMSPKYGEIDVFKLLGNRRLCPWQLGSPPSNCE